MIIGRPYVLSVSFLTNRRSTFFPAFNLPATSRPGRGWVFLCWTCLLRRDISIIPPIFFTRRGRGRGKVRTLAWIFDPFPFQSPAVRNRSTCLKSKTFTAPKTGLCPPKVWRSSILPFLEKLVCLRFRPLKTGHARIICYSLNNLAAHYQLLC